MKRWKKKLLFISLMVICFAFLSLYGINKWVKYLVKDRIVTEEQASTIEADCILVLGAGVWNNERPSHMLEDRLLQGISLYQLGGSTKIIMSGDHGRKDYDEVRVMKNYAIDMGVPSEDIFMDHAGFSTYDSLYRARDVFQAKKIIIVTQEYHMYRALYIAKALGLDAYGVTSDPRTYVGQESREVREVLARVKDFGYTIFKPKPRYLGETISLADNGDITND